MCHVVRIMIVFLSIERKIQGKEYKKKKPIGEPIGFADQCFA